MSLADSDVATSRPVLVRAMTTDDLAFAAALHEKSLSHGFFGRLGVRFLAAYYASFLASPHADALIADTADGAAGTLVGTFCNASHYSWVMRNRGLVLARRGIVALLAHPAELTFFLRTRVRRYLTGLARLARRSLSGAPAGGPVPRRSASAPAVLTHIAVDDQARGAGVGASLVSAFLECGRRAGCREACLVTLQDERGAGAFYRRLGWELHEVVTDRDGQSLESYRWRL